MARLANRIKKMPDTRWLKKIMRCDPSSWAEGWCNQVQHILQYANMDVELTSDEEIDLDVLESRLLQLNRQKWLLDASSKTKLRTFIAIYDSKHPRDIVESLLPCRQRSIVLKLKSGVLPLHIQMGHWKDKPLEHRTPGKWVPFLTQMQRVWWHERWISPGVSEQWHWIEGGHRSSFHAKHFSKTCSHNLR